MSTSKISSCIEGLDVLLGGGLPQNRTILVAGGPGSGKSILATQFLTGPDSNGVYVSLDYSKKSFFSDMLNFGWDFEKREKEGTFVFLSGSTIRRIPQIKNSEDTMTSMDELTIEDLMDMIKIFAEKIDAKKVVIDDVTSLTFSFTDEVRRRGAILFLMESLNDMGVSSLIISEANVYGTNREINIEEFLSDGVIRMFTLRDGTRAIQVSKMRGMPVDTKPHPYSIVDKTGIVVFPDESVFTDTASSVFP